MSLASLIRKEGTLQPARIGTMCALTGLSSAGVLAIINGAAANVSHHQPTTSYFFAFVGLVALYSLAKRFVLQASIRETEQIVHRIRLRIVDKVLSSDLIGLERIGRANIAAAASKETRTISTATVLLITAAEAATMLVFAVAYLAWLSLAAFVIGVGFTMGAVLIHLRRMRHVNEELRKSIEDENASIETLVDFLDGFKEIKINDARAADIRNYFSNLSARATERKIDAQSVMASHYTLTQVMFYMLIGTMVFVVPIFSQDFAGAVVKTATSVLFLFGSISTLVSSLPVLAQANAAADAIQSMEQELDRVSRPSPAPSEPLRAFERISFTNVSFEHHDARGNASFAVGPLNLELRAGETVFITGGNGSGKSTLMRLLVGLYRPASGSIGIDGRPVDDQSIVAYRNMFAAVFSDFHLFKRLFGMMEADAARIEGLLRLLEIEGKTGVTEGAFDTLDLSGGQRKRVALAVALLEDRPVLVLDEWAADQDPVFRKKFYEQLLPELKRLGKTIIAITHDDHYFHLADRQLRMEYGQIGFDSLGAGRA